MRRALLIAAVLVTIACGSEGGAPNPTSASSGVPATPTLTSAESVDRAAFVRSVNAACREYAERDEALEFPDELDGYVTFMRAFIENSSDLDEKLSALRPPATIEDFDDYVADNRRQTDVLRAALPKVEAAVRDDDQAEADVVIDDAIDDFNAVVDDLDPYAQRYGFTECTDGEGSA
jgi:hypothetical protein